MIKKGEKSERNEARSFSGSYPRRMLRART